MKKKYMMAACACMSCVLLGSGTYVYARPETSVTNHFSTGVVDINLARTKQSSQNKLKKMQKRTSQIWGFPLSLSMFKISKTKKI